MAGQLFSRRKAQLVPGYGGGLGGIVALQDAWEESELGRVPRAGDLFGMWTSKKPEDRCSGSGWVFGA